MKDSKDSYEQRRWEIAAKSHAACVDMLKHFTFPSAIQEVERRIAQYEAEYPQLKQ